MMGDVVVYCYFNSRACIESLTRPRGEKEKIRASWGFGDGTLGEQLLGGR